MLLAVLMVWILTMLAWYLDKPPRKICPICIGVSGTWLILTAGIISGFFTAEYKIPVAMLMGGTVVGIAFQSEKAFVWARNKIFVWKAGVVVVGIPLVYFLFIHMGLITLTAEIVLLAVIAYILFLKTGKGAKKENLEETSELEEKMRNCC